MNISETAELLRKRYFDFTSALKISIFFPLKGTNIALVLYGLLLFPGFRV